MKVQMHSSLKVASQIDLVVMKPLGTLTFISQRFEYKSWNVMLTVVQDVGEAKFRSIVFSFGQPVRGRISLSWKECKEDR